MSDSFYLVDVPVCLLHAQEGRRGVRADRRVKLKARLARSPDFVFRRTPVPVGVWLVVFGLLVGQQEDVYVLRLSHRSSLQASGGVTPGSLWPLGREAPATTGPVTSKCKICHTQDFHLAGILHVAFIRFTVFN
ncbi:hypothetical protein NL108_018499 [Boleophthalmus pectinirostris]|nr:hypothetical protein NL108_018499 [Boleophthalmus pectinirostris]